jgi:hypothetical protein
MVSEIDHAAPVAPRLGFQPPRIFLVPHGGPAPVVPMIDLAGTALSVRPVVVHLSYDEKTLYLHAEGDDPTITCKPALAPDDPQFWTQDHVEWRLLRADGTHLQLIAALDGRCWDSQGMWHDPAILTCRSHIAGTHWTLDVQVSAFALGLPALAPGCVLHGLVAQTRWGSGYADIVCCTAAELGFQQQERFAEFVLGPPIVGPIVTDVRLPDTDHVILTLANPAAVPVTGYVTLTADRTGETPTHAQVPYAIASGETAEKIVPYARVPRRFTRLHIAVDNQEQLALSLCVPLPPLPDPVPVLVHPYLYFDADGLAAFRRNAALSVFTELAAMLHPEPADFHEDHLPPPGGRFCFDFDAESMQWGRVARETLLRDGASGKRPAAARIWSLLPPAVQETVRAVAAKAGPSDEEVAVLLSAFNVLLRRRDLYLPEAFADVRLPPEGETLLAHGVAQVDDDAVIKCNRILLQSAIECCHSFKVDLAARAGSYLAKWLLSGDMRLVDLATRTAQAAADSMIPEATFHLHEGNAAPALALAYDTWHPLLTDAQRGHWRRLLVTLLDLYLQSARAGAWTVSAIPNANPVANAGAGFLALALWEEEPEKAQEALGWVRRYIWRWLDYCFGDDGGNTEGCQYWQYGTESWVRFAALYERFFGCEDGLLDHPALRNGMNMIRVALCNDGALHGVNDTIPVPCGIELAWFWAGRYGDPFALWYGDHAQRWFRQAIADGRPAPYRPAPLWSILFRPEAPEVFNQPEPLPQVFALRSIEYGIMRSGPEWACRWTAGLKGSRPPYTHHNQADTGAVFVDVRGERLLIDPGYYKPAATDHCLPLIDGVGPEQPTTWTGALIACAERGDLRYLACDATAAYRGAAIRAIRHLVLVGEEAVVLLDDLVPARDGAVITAQYQCGGNTEAVNDQTMMIYGQQAAVQLQILSHTNPLIRHPERTLHDIHWGYHFAACRLFPVTMTYQATHHPLITCLQDATDGMPVPAVFEKTETTQAVILPSGTQVIFRRSAQIWILAKP